jgi:hypothetical protein
VVAVTATRYLIVVTAGHIVRDLWVRDDRAVALADANAINRAIDGRHAVVHPIAASAVPAGLRDEVAA